MQSGSAKNGNWIWSGVKAAFGGFFGCVLLLIPIAFLIEKEMIPTGREEELSYIVLFLSTLLSQILFASRQNTVLCLLFSTAGVLFLLVLSAAAMKDFAFVPRQIITSLVVEAAGNTLGAFIRFIKSGSKQNRKRHNITGRNQKRRFT